MTEKKSADESARTCFIIMPISDPEGYESGHFRRVYEDLFKPACKKAGYDPIRADDVTQTNFIHLDILKRLINSPMALCDLSGRNPNVLFELGLRQAFDRKTVLVQEIGTPKIFDIAPLRILEYSPALKYREVLNDQDAIASAVTSTQASTAEDGVNSLIRLLELVAPATLKTPSKVDAVDLYNMLRAELQQLRSEIRSTNDSAMQTSENQRFTSEGRSLINRAVIRQLLKGLESGILFNNHVPSKGELGEISHLITLELQRDPPMEVLNELVAYRQRLKELKEKSQR